MKINLNILTRDELQNHVSEKKPTLDAELEKSIEFRSAAFNEILSISKDIGYFEYWVDFKFTKKELSTLKAFRLVTNKNPLNSDNDSNAYFDYKDELKMKINPNENFLKYVNKCFVSKNVINSANLQIFGISGFELPLITLPAMNLLVKEGYDEYIDFLNVNNLKTNSIRKDIFFIKPKYSYKNFIHDKSITTYENEGLKFYRPNGCITYSKNELSKNLPIALTNENLGHSGCVVVNSEFIKILKNLNIKGLKYWEVLEKSSVLYNEYEKIWNKMLRDISINPKNKLLYT